MEEEMLEEEVIIDDFTMITNALEDAEKNEP